MSEGAKHIALRKGAGLELLTGKYKGAVYEISNSRFTIGRSQESDIHIHSEAVSRHHATIEIDPNGEFIIRDTGSKNGIIVNGQQVSECYLKAGDLVQVGDYSFRFKLEGTDSESGGEVPLPVEFGGVSEEPIEPDTGKTKRKRIFIYGGAALLLIYILQLSSETPNSDTTGNNSTNKKTEFTPIEPPELALGQNSTVPPGYQDPLATTQELSAEKQLTIGAIQSSEDFFRRGQREYFSHNFNRAIDAFETALSVNRKHPLAGTYLTWAKSEAGEEAKNHHKMGMQYMSSHQYERAIYHFKEVISLLAHQPQEPLVKQSQKNIRDATEYLAGKGLNP